MLGTCNGNEQRDHYDVKKPYLSIDKVTVYTPDGIKGNHRVLLSRHYNNKLLVSMYIIPR